LALSRFGITPEEFYELSPVEFYLALADWNKKQENEIKVQYESVRYLAVHIWNAAGKSLKRPISDAQKQLPLPWDKENVKLQSIEEQKRQLKLIASRFGRKDKKIND